MGRPKESLRDPGVRNHRIVIWLCCMDLLWELGGLSDHFVRSTRSLLHVEAPLALELSQVIGWQSRIEQLAR